VVRRSGTTRRALLASGVSALSALSLAACDRVPLISSAAQKRASAPGYAIAELTAQVLQRAGENPTRAAFMTAAESFRGDRLAQAQRRLRLTLSAAEWYRTLCGCTVFPLFAVGVA
jgi:hypothetical protein